MTKTFIVAFVSVFTAASAFAATDPAALGSAEGPVATKGIVVAGMMGGGGGGKNCKTVTKIIKTGNRTVRDVRKVCH